MLYVRGKMLHELKPFHCPFCNNFFSSRDYGRHHNVSNFPLLLKCGHSVCESCARNSALRHKKIICLECQLPTDLSGGDLAVSSLLPDVHVLGVLSANMKRSLPSLKMKMQTLGQTYDAKRRQKQNYTPTICDECLKNEACWSCEKCSESFCSICFDHIHSKGIKSMQKHEKKPIDRTIYNSMIQKSCEDHSNRDLEFFCDEDSELACSYCCVTGKHKGHNVLTLRQKNMSCHAELKSAYETALQVKKRLKYSEKKLSDAIPALKTDNTPEISKIHNYFHALHAALQLREQELIEQIKEINVAKIVPLEKMCQQLREYEQNLNDLLLDAQKTLRDSSVVINTPALIKKLDDSKNLPQHLMPVSCGESCDIDIRLEDVLPLLKSIGQISADVQEMYQLKSSTNLPVGYILDPVFDVASVTTETESVRSEVFSEDSLCSPLLSGKPDVLDSADDFSHRPYSMSHADRVVVSHIRDPGKFWVQKCSESRKLKTMSDSVNKWCRSAESSRHMPSHIVKGDLYLVQYSGDNKWYRARVKDFYTNRCTNENENNSPAVEDDTSNLTELCSELTELHLDDFTSSKNPKVEVLYVDYGNSEVVPVNRLKNIQTRFLNVPGMAKECSLYDIFPVVENSWSPEAIKIFARFVGNKEVTMLVSEERSGVLYVDLCQAAVCDITNDVPVSVRDALVFLEFGQFTDQKNIGNVFSQRSVRQFVPSDKLPEDSNCNVILSHIENPSMFYVQKISTAGNLSNLINDMNMTYKSDAGNTLYQVYVPYVGMVCAAKYSVDKQWYRARVLSLPGGAMVEVQYVDFGNKEIVHNRYLRKLFDRFLKLSIQAIACSLSEVRPASEEGWTPEAKNWMMKMAYKKQLYLKSVGMIEKENKASVVLFDIQENSTLCLNAVMVEEGLAANCGPGLPRMFQSEDLPLRTVSSKENVHVSEIAADNEKSKLAHDVFRVTSYNPSILAKRNYKENFIPVFVSHVESPGLFYLQLGTKIREDLKKVMEDMQLIYKDFDSILKDVTVGGMYAVFKDKEHKWYRGSVQKVEDDVAKVFFLDYGFVQDVKIENIRTLVDDLHSEEPSCHRCHLSGIEPAGGSKQWPTVSIEAFKDMLSSGASTYFIRKGHDEERNSLASELYVEVFRRGGALEPSVFEYINVADALMEKGIVLPVRKKSECAVVKSSCDSAGTSNYPQDCSSPVESSCPVPSESSHNLIPQPHKTTQLQCKPTLRWKPYEPPALRNFTAVVTYVDENGSVFLHDKEKGTSTIDIIKKALCYKYSKAEHPKLHIPPPIGQACIAKFHLDNQWYRAEVVTTKPDSVKVLFVDYGNIENVSLNDICMDVIMIDTPAQGVECQLAEIEPATPDKKWPTDILDFLHLAVVEQECTINVTTPPEPGKPLQIFLTLGGIEMRTVLIQMGCATIIESSSPVHRKLNDSPLLSENKRVKKDVIFNTFKKATPLREGEPFQVCVTQLLEPNLVFLQQMKVDEPASDYDQMRNTELENFLSLIKQLADKAENLPPVEKPELGVPYCAKYSYDNSWYRCEVTDIGDEDISVLYVDYGNSEVIPVESLRRLDGHFVDFPVQSHLCKLHRVEPITEDGWSSEVVATMVDNLFSCTSTLHARVVNPGEVCEVELLTKHDGSDNEWELAYQKLVNDNLIRLEVE